MDQIFYPSILISHGPSSRKALEISKKLVSSIPNHFTDLIEYYNLENISTFKNDVQGIIDNKLLYAKNLNKLVDLGFKVRSDCDVPVKLNVYFLWDVYNSHYPASEVVDILTEIKYGNVDRDLNSGVCLYVLPIIEKEWTVEDRETLKSLQDIRKLIDYVSREENLLNMDSKLYMLHCISSDGTRIPKEELEYIAGLLTYLNIIPSKDPPLSHFNRRLMMNEGSYKIGSIGITSLTIFKDELIDDFSKYYALDILKHAVEYESKDGIFEGLIFAKIKYDNVKLKILQDVDIVETTSGYTLKDAERLSLERPNDISLYPTYFKNWEEYIENNRVIEFKGQIDNKSGEYREEILNDIRGKVKEIVSDSGLKEGINYIDKLAEEIKKQRTTAKMSSTPDFADFKKKFLKFIDNYPSIEGLIVKLVILFAFTMYSFINIIFPYINSPLKPLFLASFIIIFILLAYLDYAYRKKKLDKFVQKYMDSIFKKHGALLNIYSEKTIINNNKVILFELDKLKSLLKNCISNLQNISISIKPQESENDRLGNLITSLLDYEDRLKYYRTFTPDILASYGGFLKVLDDYTLLAIPETGEALLGYTRELTPRYIEKDFYEFLIFKYGSELKNKVSKWVDRGVVKSKYLLQYIKNDSLEEHALFITSPEVHKISRDIVSSKLNNFQVSLVDGQDIHTNCISIIRLCLGIDFNNISSVKSFERRGEQ